MHNSILMEKSLVMEDRSNILRRMKVCRFCLCNEEDNLLNIQEKHPQDPDINIPLPSLSLQIMACVSIEVLQSDGMPQFICKDCRNITTQAYIFKTNCKKSDDALKLFLLTGQMAKPYMHDVVQIKVAPASEKCISIVQEDEEVEKNEIVTTTTMGGETKINNAVAETEEAVHDRLVEEFPEGTIVEIENETVETVETSCFPCNECDRSFPLQQLLDLHMEKHTKERNFECEVCLNKFYTIYDLQKHSLIHNPDKGFECGVCNKSFNRVSFLRKHEKIHKDVEWHTCPKCDKSFMSKENLNFHMHDHNKSRPFGCKICNKSFVFKQGLERHEVIHSNNKPHKCNYCDASFISAIKLTRHITSHAGLRPYPCKICGRTFLLSHHLTRHMRSHYSSNPTETIIGQYKCDICSMAFRRKDSLINHSAIHSMVNLKCVICNTTFETVDLVKEHITTHLASLPFPCDKCDYSFETEEQLEEHELRHAEMEYEEQIEKEVFSESIMQITRPHSEEEDEAMEEDEGTEISQFTMVDINNPSAGVRPTITTSKNSATAEEIVGEFLKDEFDPEAEQSKEGEEEEEEVEEVPIEPLKPIIRQEGTKVYQRKNIHTRTLPEIRMTPSLADPNPKPTAALQDIATPDTSTHSLGNKTVKMGDKLVKVQKFILTTDEMKAMAKQGIIELRGGQVVLRSKGQQVLNASIKSIDKNEIDSLLDKRNKIQLKKYDKKVVSSGTSDR
ncbi:zinc finger protein 271-like [Diabrotica virgifera virgifera]|uniref:Uncharacterized protein n=2 Tax=Diabrotica virgifera virgifera TaxID=50390 RepID=A0ABM5L4G0_DIAVI|nr:zinc finger protein 271-like [Diabrotica virgifera virgifera]